MKLHLILHFTRKSAMPVGPRLQVKNQNPFCVDTGQASPNNHFCDTFNFLENFIVQLYYRRLKGILHQKIFYRLNLIFWILMGCGIARFGRKGLKTTETWKFWSQNLSPGVLRRGAPGVSRRGAMGFRGAAPMIKHFSDLSFCAVPRGPIWLPSKPQVRRASKPLRTNFETKIFKFRWFLGPSD